MLIDTGRFERCFEAWVRSFGAPLDREVVAIDGKTIRGSFDRGREQGPLHVVSAWACDRRLVLGQRQVGDKPASFMRNPWIEAHAHSIRAAQCLFRIALYVKVAEGVAKSRSGRRCGIFDEVEPALDAADPPVEVVEAGQPRVRRYGLDGWVRRRVLGVDCD